MQCKKQNNINIFEDYLRITVQERDEDFFMIDMYLF